MVFIESEIFSKQIREILSDDELAELQSALAARPKMGDVIRGTGGLCKLRLPDRRRGQGKRGGARMLYLHLPDRAHIHLLLVYGKDQQADLTTAQKKQLRVLVERIKSTQK